MKYAITTATTKIAAMTKRIRAVQGGTEASKTISILLLLINAAQKDDVPTLTSVVSESLPHLKKGALRDFEKIMKAHRYWQDSRWRETDRIYTFESGSQMEFFGAEDADKLRGGRRERLFINEANNVPFAAFEELEVRTKEFIFLDWNPVAEFWFDTEVKGKRDDVEHIVLNYRDNEAARLEIVAAIEQRKANRPNWYQVYGLGEYGEAEGRIYTGWQIIDEIPHEARLERYGIDFGYYPDPAGIVAIYYWNGGYILDEIAYGLELPNRELAAILKNLPKTVVVADSAEPKSIDELKLFGLNVIGAQKGPDSKRYGIKTVQGLRISITKRSVNLIKEYRNYYQLIDRRTNTPVMGETDGMDDLLDAARYGLCSLVPIIQRKEFIDALPRLPPRQRTNRGL